MDEDPGLSDQYRMASPWPLFIALGIPIAEVGILFDLAPLSVGGLILFCGSAAGMAKEAGYAKTPWRALVVCSVLLFGLGGLFLYADTLVTAEGIQLLARGYAVIAAAVILLVGSLVGRTVLRDPSPF
ncbi:hypothetical protein SAMN04487949_1030 [Halogranum gelatinilyticum]|jgi:uncharacterized membrane protein|uniref:Cox cluster protein n=1 Tax=Halogranum gelatinilyticum TaxID=660521 RepID=A0A1G9QUD0_9EURY|nr:cox cluster protein [Halogranum gelatinilyticum]SDM14616.1 hypothetical protein SAMN04487949_1030 [Halogranum gelatinilyticum]